MELTQTFHDVQYPRDTFDISTRSRGRKMLTLQITQLAVRPATNGFKKPAPPKKSRVRPNAAVMQEESGLYGTSTRLWNSLRLTKALVAEVFSNVHTMDAVAADWIARYQQHNANAMCELINFVLRCTGCSRCFWIHTFYYGHFYISP